MTKKIAAGTLPKINDKGYFYTFDEVTLRGVTYPKGTCFKVLSMSKTGKTVVVRKKYCRDSSAIGVSFNQFAKK